MDEKTETFKDMVIGALTALIIIMSVFGVKMYYDQKLYTNALEARNVQQMKTINELTTSNELIIPSTILDDL